MSQKGKPLRLRMKTFTDKDGKMYLRGAAARAKMAARLDVDQPDRARMTPG